MRLYIAHCILQTAHGILADNSVIEQTRHDCGKFGYPYVTRSVQDRHRDGPLLSKGNLQVRSVLKDTDR